MKPRTDGEKLQGGFMAYQPWVPVIVGSSFWDALCALTSSSIVSPVIDESSRRLSTDGQFLPFSQSETVDCFTPMRDASDCCVVSVPFIHTRSRFMTPAKRIATAPSIGDSGISAIADSVIGNGHHSAMATERTFWARVKEAMEDEGLHATQSVAADTFQVAQPTISDWNKPGAGPAMETGIAVARRLKVCVEWLYNEEGPKRPGDAYNSSDPQVRRLLQSFSRLNSANRESVSAHCDFTLERQRQQARSAIKPVS